MKLNLGSGSKSIEGYTNIDISNGELVYPLLSYEDNSVDEVRASHILEHFSYRDTHEVLKEWVRVLKPNGWLKIAVPNLSWISEQILFSNPSLMPLHQYIVGGQIDQWDYHKNVFTYTSLYQHLLNHGLTDIQLWKSEIQDCAALEVSLNLKGRKHE
jgi:predicted SAM-dependent methyltransferase